MSATFEGDQTTLASLPATPPSVALNRINETNVTNETSGPAGPERHFVIEPSLNIEKNHWNEDFFAADRIESGRNTSESCANARSHPADSEQRSAAGPDSDLFCAPHIQVYPSPDQIAVEVHDKSTFTTLTVNIGIEEGISSPEQLLDPYQLMRRRAKNTDTWPYIGTAGNDWNFTTLANRGEPVCALMVAIESHHVDHIFPLISALELDTATESIREKAGEIALRCMNSIGALDRKHLPFFCAALTLIGSGALIPGGLAALGALTVNYVAEPDEHAWRRLPSHAKIETTMLDSIRTTSAVAAILMAALPRDITRVALKKMVQDDPQTAVEHRECALDNAPLLHLAVIANRLDCLQAMQDCFQRDEQHWAQTQSATDSLGRTAVVLADAMERRTCAHNLRVNASKFAACSVLLQELG